MDNLTLNQFAETVKSISSEKGSFPETLKIFDDGQVSSYYAPFEHINSLARLVICGITSGHQQATIALAKAGACLKEGWSIEEAKEAAKKTASFAGGMRKNLTLMMDDIGLNKWLNITSCADLFSTQTHLVHYTSALRYPVFRNGENYNGTPSMVKHRQLRNMIETCLAQEAKILGVKTLWLPLGPKVTEALVTSAPLALCSQARYFRACHTLPGQMQSASRSSSGKKA